MSSDLVQPMSQIELAIRREHVEQLRYITVENNPVENEPVLRESYFNMLVRWSEESKTYIDNAVKAQATGTGTIDWEIVIYTFMESAAVYLRDNALVVKAVEAAHAGHLEEAVNYLRDADKLIQKLAAIWSMKYVTICDLTHDHPDTHPWWNGPFCGAFYSDSPQGGFLGITFKGTNFKNISDLLVDWNYELISAGKHLWGSNVSEGSYTGLFTNFKALPIKIPYEYIKAAIHTIYSGASSPAPIKVHTTGHSLGAAYTTLCYAELLREFNDQPFQGEVVFVLRDLYTFGCPRFADDLLPEKFSDSMANHDGFSWRLRNEEDPITLIPPRPTLWAANTVYIHIDTAYKVSTRSTPKMLPTERGTVTKPITIWSATWHLTEHFCTSYYASLYYTASGKAPSTRSLALLGNDDESFGLPV